MNKTPVASMKPLALIVAVSRNGVIGNKGTLPWHIPTDLKWFKKHTTGHAVIMGRRTYESIGKPLPNRRMLIVSTSLREAAGCEVFTSFEQALEAAYQTDTMPFVIGGSAMYQATLPRATHLYLTRVERDVPGDTSFPHYDASAWSAVSTEADTEHGVTFCIFARTIPLA
jgi:dihydrofolate reductase